VFATGPLIMGSARPNGIYLVLARKYRPDTPSRIRGIFVGSQEPSSELFLELVEDSRTSHRTPTETVEQGSTANLVLAGRNANGEP
jgi:hypothetical protein